MEMAGILKIFLKQFLSFYFNYRCLRIWDIDVRGVNDGMFRVWIKGIHYIFLICPGSNYCDHI